jgi:hypothetical protein
VLGPSMLLDEITEPLLGRRRSAVLIMPGFALLLALALGPVGLLTDGVVLQRNWASVETDWPAVLAV